MDGFPSDVASILRNRLRGQFGVALDVGCGTGLLAECALDDSQLELVRADIEISANPGVVSDLLFLPFRSDSFHFILCRNVPLFHRDTVRGLNELNRVACSGSTIAIGTFGDRGFGGRDHWSAFHSNFLRDVRRIEVLKVLAVYIFRVPEREEIVESLFVLGVHK